MYQFGFSFVRHASLSLAVDLSVFREYYFSEINLQKDFFLRRKMDKEGWIPISLIASFHRVQQLTQDVQMIIEVCSELCAQTILPFI